MKLCVTIDVCGAPDVVFEYLNSDAYLTAAATADGILRAEAEERSEDGDKLIVATRWYAPTKLPRILRKYESRAPDSVNWLERMVWDTSTYKAELSVRPDVPESWHSRYRSSGIVRLEAASTGTQLRQDLEFSMDLGIIGKALERLLKNEIETLLQQRLDVLCEHFA